MQINNVFPEESEQEEILEVQNNEKTIASGLPKPKALVAKIPKQIEETVVSTIEKPQIIKEISVGYRERLLINEGAEDDLLKSND